MSSPSASTSTTNVVIEPTTQPHVPDQGLNGPASGRESPTPPSGEAETKSSSPSRTNGNATRDNRSSGRKPPSNGAENIRKTGRPGPRVGPKSHTSGRGENSRGPPRTTSWRAPQGEGPASRPQQPVEPTALGGLPPPTFKQSYADAARDNLNAIYSYVGTHDPDKPLPPRVFGSNGRMHYVPTKCYYPKAPHESDGAMKSMAIRSMIESANAISRHGMAGGTHPTATVVRGLMASNAMISLLTQYPLKDCRIDKTLRRLVPLEPRTLLLLPDSIWVNMADIGPLTVGDKHLIVEKAYLHSFEDLFEKSNPASLSTMDFGFSYLFKSPSFTGFPVYQEMMAGDSSPDIVLTFSNSHDSDANQFFVAQCNAIERFKAEPTWDLARQAGQSAGAEWRKTNNALMNATAFVLGTEIVKEGVSYIESRPTWGGLPSFSTTHGHYASTAVCHGEPLKNISDFCVRKYCRVEERPRTTIGSNAIMYTGVLIPDNDISKPQQGPIYSIQRLPAKKFTVFCAAVMKDIPANLTSGQLTVMLSAKIQTYATSFLSSTNLTEDVSVNKAFLQHMMHEMTLRINGTTSLVEGTWYDSILVNFTRPGAYRTMLYQRNGLSLLDSFVAACFFITSLLYFIGFDGMSNIIKMLVLSHPYAFWPMTFIVWRYLKDYVAAQGLLFEFKVASPLYFAFALCGTDRFRAVCRGLYELLPCSGMYPELGCRPLLTKSVLGLSISWADFIGKSIVIALTYAAAIKLVRRPTNIRNNTVLFIIALVLLTCTPRTFAAETSPPVISSDIENVISEFGVVVGDPTNSYCGVSFSAFMEGDIPEVALGKLPCSLDNLARLTLLKNNKYDDESDDELVHHAFRIWQATTYMAYFRKNYEFDVPTELKKVMEFGKHSSLFVCETKETKTDEARCKSITSRANFAPRKGDAKMSNLVGKRAALEKNGKKFSREWYKLDDKITALANGDSYYEMVKYNIRSAKDTGLDYFSTVSDSLEAIFVDLGLHS